MTGRRTLLWAALLGLLPGLAQAATATVTAQDLQVHARADLASPVIEVLPERTTVSVSDAALGGFRTVRLADGRIGYVEDRGLAVAGAPPVPPPPPAAPPPPGWRRYRAYPPPVYADPVAFRHLGFFLRFELGLGYLNTSAPSPSPSVDFDSSHGAAGQIGVSVGGAVAENFILGAQFWGSWVASPTVSSGGLSAPTGGDFTTSLVGIGPTFSWYAMPANVYLAITPSLTWVSFGDSYGGFTTAPGFGTRFALGKEWWVAPRWGVGVSGWFAFSFNGDTTSAGPTWRTYTGGLALTTTFD